MKTAVIILHYGSTDTTKNCLKKLKKKIGNHKVILINNTSQNIKKLQKIIKGTLLVENKKNLGFAKGVNQGISLALADEDIDSVLLLNNDLEITFGTIDMLRKTLFTKKKAGIVSPTLHHSEDLYDWGAKLNKWTGNAKHQNFKQKPKRVITVDSVAGAAMLIKKSLIEEIGLFDEQFFLYFEDADFCLRARKAGYKVLIDPEVVADHEVSKSSSPLKRTYHQWKSHILFMTKHMFRGIYPTAIIYDVTFYPLVMLKLLITGNFK